MKKGTIKFLLIAVFLVGAIIAVMSFRKKGEEESDAPDIEPADLAQRQIPLEITEGEGERLILRRMRQLNAATNDRNEIMAEVGVQNPLNATADKGAVLEVLQNAGLSQVPIIPPFLNPEFPQEVNNFLEARPFEEIARADFEQAKKTYKNALNFSSLGVSLFPAVENAVNANAFGKAQAAGDHERNRYWDYDNAINQLKKVFSSAIQAGEQLEQGLRDTAIIELEQAGYNFV